MQSTVSIYASTESENFAALFSNPPALFRGAPFWSWNNKLDTDQLCRQIEMFKKMGIGGFHMHSRVGMNTAYLSDAFMAAVKACVDKAKQEDMIAWLYDEDRWPSGAAGGLVTKDARYRARHVLFTPRPYEQAGAKTTANRSGAFAERTANGHVLARYAITLRDGFLAAYRRLTDDETLADGEEAWFAYLEIAQPSPWYNNQTYVDTLNPAAIAKFVEITHERYKEVVGDQFGTRIPGIFTDEPQFSRKRLLTHSADKTDVMLPFTDDFPDSYRQSYAADILDSLPEVIWELPDGRASVTRYRYHDHVTERFAAAFADTIGQWCETNGLVLTGHLMEEPTLESQTNLIGDAMRSYRSFQLPGIDILCDRQEFTTAKQAQSASHQYGRNGVLSELYGVTDWDFDFTGHKCQGDWQAALGVTVRVHHLSWVSMAGEAKRDYPASIFYQSPWWEKYATVEDHFARVNVALTRGNPRVRVAVVHPIESFWLCYGPQDKTAVERDEREDYFQTLTEWLLFGLIDFDFVCESTLPELTAGGDAGGGQFHVGAMAYDAVVLPPMRTIRRTTLERLEAFVDAGGNLIVVGEVPSLVDAQPSERPRQLAERVACTAFAKARILAALEPLREVDVRLPNGTRANQLLHQVRDVGDRRLIFICNTARHHGRGRVTVRIKGEWAVTALDTGTGAATAMASEMADGYSEIPWDCHAHAHLLLQLTPGRPATTADGPTAGRPANQGNLENATIAHLQSPVPVTLSEPNALLLDQAEWRLDDGAWQVREEILRIDNQVRDALALPRRGGQMAQPWTEAEDPTVLATLELRFQLDCRVAVETPLLAIEEPQSTRLFIDGEPVETPANGWWVDEAIRTVPLPTLGQGRHELLVRIAYRRKTNVEWCYLLGDFGVRLAGRDACVVEPVRHLSFDDWAVQGLPFYTGNITYHCAAHIAETAPVTLRVPHFSGALIGVAVDGRQCPDIAFAPFESDLGQLTAGDHKLDITLYGNRRSAFGALHWAQPQSWVGPQAWRTAGDGWCYEYRLRPVGIITAPRLLRG